MNNEFDKFSNDYSKILNDNLNGYSEYTGEYYQKYKIQLLPDNDKNLKILDFGCGIGTGCKYLKEKFKNAEITGIDVSEESIEQALKNVSDVKFVKYDGKNIPYENEFDIIYTSCVFHHIDKKEHKSIISQLKKALKPDGKLYIFEHNPQNPITRKVVKECVFDKNAVLVNPKEFKKITKCKIKYILFIPRFKILNKLFFIEKYLTKLPIGAQYCCIIEK